MFPVGMYTIQQDYLEGWIDKFYGESNNSVRFCGDLFDERF